MHDNLDQLLKDLHLKKIRQILETELRDAEAEHRTCSEFLLRLLQAEWIHKQESALAWRIKRARLPELWTIESFPFKLQPAVSRRQIRDFAGLDFVARAENIVFVGPTGVGKTGLASGLLLKALQNGYRGVFVPAQELFDEMGYLNLRPEQSNVFYRLIQERHRRKSTIITTNLEYEQWSGFLGNKLLCDALLGRLRRQCHTVRIDGPPITEATG